MLILRVARESTMFLLAQSERGHEIKDLKRRFTLYAFLYNEEEKNRKLWIVSIESK